MVIKVQVLDIQASSSTNIKYGLVVENINKKFFNRCRVNHVFDTDLVDELMIADETILQYTAGAILGSENITVRDIEGNPAELTYNYIFLSEHVLSIKNINNDVSEGDA